MGAEDRAIMEFEDLTRLELRGDNLRAFQTDWDTILSNLTEQPSDMILESLYRKQVQHATSMKGMISLYDQEIALGRATKDYERLYSLVEAQLQKMERDKMRDSIARGRGVATPAAKPKKQKGDCPQWVKGKCSRGRNCPLKHDQEKKGELRGRSPRSSTPKGSRNTRSRSPTPRNRSRSKSPSRSPDSITRSARAPCKQYLLGKCKNGPQCKYGSHPPACKFYLNGNCTKGKNCKWFHDPALAKADAAAKPQAKDKNKKDQAAAAATKNDKNDKADKANPKAKAKAKSKAKDKE